MPVLSPFGPGPAQAEPTRSVEETMAKNILLFADGTGNEGGLLPDESRTNVYKLYRATRNGPDTTIDPRKQIAFYVHGIGTPTPGQSPRKFKQRFEQMFGSSLSSRITEGYAAIISVWQPRDRIYLFKQLILRVPQWCLTPCPGPSRRVRLPNASTRKRRHTTLGYRSPIEFKKLVSTENGSTSMCLGQK
jgi:Uncharacterized alpha/beta hydrolase domain (DUF2235)